RHPLRAPAGARDRGQCRLPLVPAAKTHRSGLRCLDPVAEPAAALQRYERGAGHLRRHRRAGDRHGLVDGTVLYTDSTHLKANANKGKYDLQMIEKLRSDYWADLDRAIEAERKLHGQKPLKEKEREPQVKETKVSRTDPEAGYMVREGKPKGFFYLDHRTVDGRHAIITDTYVTPANVH